MSSWKLRFLTWLLAGTLLFSATNYAIPLAFGQIPTLPQTSSSELPSGVVRQGWFELAEVKLGGKVVLKIASPAVFNRNQPGNQIPVEVRSLQIETNFEQLLNSNQSSVFNSFDEKNVPLDSNTIKVFSETLNNQPVLFVKDAIQAEPKVLITVTDSDAQYYSTSKENLAKTWQKALQQEIQQALELRKPGALRQQANLAGVIAIGMLMFSVLVFSIRRFLKWRYENLKLYLKDHLDKDNLDQQILNQEIKTEVNHHRFERLSEQIRHQLTKRWSIERRLQIIQVFQWITFWAIVFVWVIGIASILYLFPQTRPFSQAVISTPTLLLISWFLTGLLNRIISLAIDKSIKTWEKNTVTIENSQRRSQRVSTIINALKGTVTVLVYLFGLVTVLQILNIAPTSLLAIGTLLALAVSLGVQNVIKDLVNGMLILMEDQYAVGDFVEIGSAAGIVENVNLRVTQIRSEDGRLVTLPNSLITQVDNLTRIWSRSDFGVEVAYDSDINKALEIVLCEANQLASEPAWQPYIISVGEVFGVEKISHDGILIKIWIKTIPLKQWEVARELRRRLKIAFDQNGIQIGMPQRMLIVKNSDLGSKPIIDSSSD